VSKLRQQLQVFGSDGLDTMHGSTSGFAAMNGVVRSTIMLSACTLAVALALFPVAAGRAGFNGPLGVLLSAGICLFSGLAAEATSSALIRTSPVGAFLVGMFVRMFFPLCVCVAFLATGRDGREHVYFVGYLLTFYMAMLALETWLAVKRTAPPATPHRSQG
jgi:hypothetical protein